MIHDDRTGTYIKCDVCWREQNLRHPNMKEASRLGWQYRARQDSKGHEHACPLCVQVDFLARREPCSRVKAMRHHFKKRAKQRHDLLLSDQEVDAINQVILSGRAELLYKQSSRVSTYAVRVRDALIPVVYDRRRKTPATTLAWSMVPSEYHFVRERFMGILITEDTQGSEHV